MLEARTVSAAAAAADHVSLWITGKERREHWNRNVSKSGISQAGLRLPLYSLVFQPADMWGPSGRLLNTQYSSNLHAYH